MPKNHADGSLRTLGKRLKHLRNQVNESLAEASGAVEIDVRELASFELGQSKPTEEVLLLLISHFGAKDDEAVNLWELAGYSTEKIPIAQLSNNEEKSAAQPPNSDKQILFTDVVDVVVNNYGVVMNFMQNNGQNSQPMPVARVGMSREHAKSVLQILQITLEQTEKNVPNLPKRLIKPDNDSSTT